MQTSPFFASQAPRTPFPVPSLVGGASLAAAAQAAHAVLPRGAEAPAATAPAFKVPKLNQGLYHRTVFTMPLAGKRGHAEIPIYFDKATLQIVYIANTQAFAVLCDEDLGLVQNSFSAFLGDHAHFKTVSF